MASALATSSLTRPTLAPARPSAARNSVSFKLGNARSARVAVAPRALANEMWQLAEEATRVGDVAAPSWVLPAGVVGVTLLSILSGYLLKPGADAAEQIKERDAKSGRWSK